jgi:alpha-mannosidase
VRRAIDKLRSAVGLATVVALQDPAFLGGRDAARDAAWRSVGLFFEHDIVGGGVIGDEARIAFQEAQVATIERYVDTLLADAQARMSQFVPVATAGRRFFVFNALGFSRAAPAEVPYPGTGPFSVVAAGTTTPLPAEAIGSGAQRRIRFLATSVPPLGYRLFDVRDVAPSSALPNTARFEGGVLITSRYRIIMDGRGAIQSLVEPGRGGREWVRADGGRALNDLGEGTGTVVLESNGPVSATLRADIDGPQPRTVRLTVYAGSGQIDLENRISAGFDDLKTYSFPFAIDRPLVRHEEVGAVIFARHARSGGLSTRVQNSLYEWLTLDHFADMSGSGGGDGITLSNSDAYFMRLGKSDPHRLDMVTPRIDVLAGGRINGLGLPGQGGDRQFLHRFSLMPHAAAYNQNVAMRFALEAQNPLVTGPATGPARGALLASNAWSLLGPRAWNALVWAVKPAEEGIGAGIIVRLWNQSHLPVTAGLNLQQRYTAATIQRTTNIETDVAADDPVAMPDPTALRGNQIGTFRIRLP